MAALHRRLEGARPRRGRLRRPGRRAHGAAQGRRSGATRGCARSTTSARRRSASTRSRSSTTASAAARAATSSSSCMETEGLDFAGGAGVAGRPLRGRARGARRRTRGRPSGASARERLLELLERTADVLRARAVGVATRRRPRARVPGSAAGSRRRRCASSASATRRRRGTRCSSASRRAGFTNEELLAAGLAQRGARAADLRPLPRPDHVPAGRPARAGARVRRAGDARRTSGRST